MPRRIVTQAATSRPKLVTVSDIGTDWETIAEAPDYSVPDPTVRWPGERDPEDATRRIQPGQAIITTPLFIHNRAPEASITVFIRILTQEDGSAIQAAVEIPAGETYAHPCAGITLVKDNPEAEAGDRLQVRADVEPAAIDIGFSMAVGAADQDQPA